jgi:hypothetical protein
MAGSIEQRAIAAVKGLAVARSEVERLTKEIGKALAWCKGANGRIHTNEGDITHLKHAYTPEMPDGAHGEYDYLDNEEIHEYLSETCPHCLKAHQLVRQRRIARQAHGRAKAAVTKLGRELMKGTPC